MKLEDIAQKEYFTIGEVAKITSIPEYTIRYWERAFALVQPMRKQSKHRRYTRADVDSILKIKDLIYKHKMTLEGAKKHLNRFSGVGAKPKGEDAFHTARDVKFLKEVQETLSQILKE